MYSTVHNSLIVFRIFIADNLDITVGTGSIHIPYFKIDTNSAQVRNATT